MQPGTKIFSLRIALVVIGLIFILAIYPLMQYWPSGWRWEPAQPKYEHMIVWIYITLGVFLVRAAKNPLENLSLIWFTVWSSGIHATVMLFDALMDPREFAHVYGDISALYLITLVLALLTPRKATLTQR